MAILPGVQSGLGNVANGQTYLDNLVNRRVLKPKTVQGIQGFVFDYEGETQIHVRTQITDHYAEDNRAIQDHVALQPDLITLSGFVSELVAKPPQGILGALNTIQNKLTTVPAYLGKYTPGAVSVMQKAITQAQITVETIQQAAARANNLLDMFSGAAPGDTRQKKAFSHLDALAKTRQVFVLETPYKIYENMVIETLTFMQSEENKTWSDIRVTLKEMRFVEVETTPNLLASHGGRSFLQAQAQADKGKTLGTEVPPSFLYSTFNPTP